MNNHNIFYDIKYRHISNIQNKIKNSKQARFATSFVICVVSIEWLMLWTIATSSISVLKTDTKEL